VEIGISSVTAHTHTHTHIRSRVYAHARASRHGARTGSVSKNETTSDTSSAVRILSGVEDAKTFRNRIAAYIT